MREEAATLQQAIVLVGDAARDHNRVEQFLSDNVIVILVPSLETARILLSPGGVRAAEPSVAPVGGLRIDLAEHRVLWGDRDLPVSEHELAILAILSEKLGRARSFAELAEAEGGRWVGDTDRVHSAIKRLRRKLARAQTGVRIESVRGYGFRLITRPVDRPPPISGASMSLSSARAESINLA